jgi:hypothetical protein
MPIPTIRTAIARLFGYPPAPQKVSYIQVTLDELNAMTEELLGGILHGRSRQDRRPDAPPGSAQMRSWWLFWSWFANWRWDRNLRAVDRWEVRSRNWRERLRETLRNRAENSTRLN